MLSNRKPAVLVILSVLACGSIVVAATASGSSAKMLLRPGQSLSVGCSAGSIRWAQSGGTSGVVTCSSPNSTSPSTTSTTSTTADPPATTATTLAPTTTTTTTTTPPASAGCPQFKTAPSSPIAFCDTLDTPDPTPGTRSGALNGVLWGVSRQSSSTNPGQGMANDWANSVQNECANQVQVAPDNDVRVCESELVESINDDTGQNILAMYPRQPFNFAGRTGTVEFNVSDNSQGGHAAWPTLTITDQPVPAPYTFELAGTNDVPRNSVSIALVGCSPGENCGSGTPDKFGYPNWTLCEVPQVSYSTDYQVTDPTGGLPDNWGTTGCVMPSTSPTQMNHIEVQINSSGIDVWATDAGANDLREIGQYSFPVPLTQGLVWLEDAHYNGDKFNTQQTNTFGWSDLAFDGPVLPRDLGFDVLDNTVPGPAAANGLPTTNLGYSVPSGGLTVSTANPVTTADISAATGALFEMNYMPVNGCNLETITYTVNGHVNTFNNSGTVNTNNNCPAQTIALPVPLADVVPGPNTMTVSMSDGGGDVVSNMDLILQSAGGTIPPS
jgi:hypothetical protein